MRRWRLVDGGALAELEEGRLLRLDNLGAVRRLYESSSYSFESDLVDKTWLIRGDTLLEVTKTEDGSVPETRVSERAELQGLAVLGAAESPTAEEVAEIMASRQSSQRAAEADVQRRIDELCRSDLPVLPQLERPRRRLAERVVRYNDELAAQALALLDEMAHIEQLIGSSGIDAAERVHVRDELRIAARVIGEAAAFVTFDHQANDDPIDDERSARPSADEMQRAVRSLQATEEQAGRALLDALGTLEALRQAAALDAEHQERVDARLNAISYRRAAARLADAAVPLEVLCIDLERLLGAPQRAQDPQT